MQNTRIAFSLSEREFSSIDEFRKRANTAVLTIMFTDIQGFTALTENKGENYVHMLHEAHDKILVDTIEQDGDGIVIKFIGDSIMAVFAEPTAAVRKALLIQERLSLFNSQNPGIDTIMVRIGLHMGQTVIENKIQTDLFGRHVNKASRIESLASGGHIYLSYPVFDSVKGWLMDIPNAESRLHGSYYLKGIEKPEEIYEIWDKQITTPEPPKNARKLSSVSSKKIIVVSVILLAILLAVFGFSYRQQLLSAKRTNTDATQITNQQENELIATEPENTEKKIAATDKHESNADTMTSAPNKSVPNTINTIPEVYFLGMIAREPILDFDTPLAVTLENETQGLKKSINDISIGKHVIHYVVSYMVRYYAEFDVKPGKNVIQIAFKQSYLPGADIHYNLSTDGPNEKTSKQQGTYFLYDRKTKKRIDYDGSINVSVKGVKAESGKVAFFISYEVLLNGAEIAKKNISIESDPLSTEWVRLPRQVLHSEGDHLYFIQYEHIGETIQVSVGASFKD